MDYVLIATLIALVCIFIAIVVYGKAILEEQAEQSDKQIFINIGVGDFITCHSAKAKRATILITGIEDKYVEGIDSSNEKAYIYADNVLSLKVPKKDKISFIQDLDYNTSCVYGDLGKQIEEIKNELK